MESVGIDVFRTLRTNRIDYEFKPVDKVVLVCLLCSKIEIMKGNRSEIYKLNRIEDIYEKYDNKKV